MNVLVVKPIEAGSDVDGTLLPYMASLSNLRLNWSLIGTMLKLGIRRLSIVTNQGGLIYGYLGKIRSDGVEYPTPDVFGARMRYLQSTLAEAGITIGGIRVSLYHSYMDRVATSRQVESCADLVRNRIRGISDNCRVYTTQVARKPQPYMINSLKNQLGVNLFYGDSDDDRGAALGAGIHFVPVKRFL